MVVPRVAAPQVDVDTRPEVTAAKAPDTLDTPATEATVGLAGADAPVAGEGVVTPVPQADAAIRGPGLGTADPGRAPGADAAAPSGDGVPDVVGHSGVGPVMTW